ncbi:MAG: sensor histidine kinase [Flavobacterium sp.]
METLDQLSNLFRLDIRNSIGLLFWGNLVLSGMIFSFYSTILHKKNRTRLLLFGSSKIIQTLAWLMFFLRTDELLFYKPLLFTGNTLLYTSFYMESILMLMMITSVSKKAYQLQTGIFILSLLMYNFTLFSNLEHNLLITFGSLSIFLILVIPSIRFITETRNSLFKKLFGINYLMFLGILLIRSVYPFIDSKMNIFTINPIQNTTFLILFLMMIISGAGYLLLIQEENEIRIKKLLSDKDKIFSIIAHDLKGPFTGISGLSEVLLDKNNGLNPERIDELHQMIYNSSRKAHSLLENLLIWAQSQTGRIKFNPTELKACSIVSETLELLSGIADNKKIKLLAETEKDQNIFADENMLLTIIRNLVSNAIKFTHTDGTIKVSVKKTDTDFLFSVKDNGVGIPPEKTDNLFETKTKNSTLGTNNETGTGLGLMICSEFVKKHGGKIWVESEMGKGSDFKFTIPQ